MSGSRIEPGIFSAPTQSYKLVVVEVAALEQVVKANKLLDELNKNGFIALYINFDTNKAELKADGKAAVAETSSALKSAPNLKIGDRRAHRQRWAGRGQQDALRKARAESVMAAVTGSGGIDAKRLACRGLRRSRSRSPTIAAKKAARRTAASSW